MVKTDYLIIGKTHNNLMILYRKSKYRLVINLNRVIVFCQGNTAVRDIFGDFWSHVAKMPWLVLVAGNGFLALRIADNKAELGCIVLQPFCLFRSCKTFLCRTFAVSSSHINREPCFVLTRSRRHNIGKGFLIAILFHIVIEQCRLGFV